MPHNSMYSYNPLLAIEYAKKYAFNYNPAYPNYSDIDPGGDCANFISQCLHAGGIPMIGTNANDITDSWFCFSNYKWAISQISRTWRGAYFFYIFWSLHAKSSQLFMNESLTNLPEKKELLAYAKPGDAINLIRSNNTVYHTLLIMKVTDTDILCAAHTNDTDSTPLTKYNPDKFKIYKFK